MTDQAACTDAELIRSFEGYELFPLVVRLLARGRPLELDELAAVAGRPTHELETLLRSQPGGDWDGNRLVGFGLTQRPTEHRYAVSGRALYTWCAADTLLFTVILGLPAVVESRCHATGRFVRVEVAPDGIVSVDPAEAVVSQRQPAGDVCDIRREICDHGHFFASAAAAGPWLEEHGDGSVVSVAEALASAQATCQMLGWVPAREC